MNANLWTRKSRIDARIIDKVEIRILQEVSSRYQVTKLIATEKRSYKQEMVAINKRIYEQEKGSIDAESWTWKRRIDAKIIDKVEKKQSIMLSIAIFLTVKDSQMMAIRIGNIVTEGFMEAFDL